MIVGVGIDLAEIVRFRVLLDKWGEKFTKRIFTQIEREYADSKGLPEQHYAARFAAKEACLKALGVPQGLSWHEMEILRKDKAPVMKLTGRAKEEFDKLGANKTHVSLTHSQTTASAIVIIEKV